MNSTINSKKVSRKRGISQIIGSLFMLAIVVPIGVVILSTGLYEVADFNRFLTVTRDQGINAVREDIIFEHVRFEPSTNQITVSLRNISTVELIVHRITIVNMTNQDLLIYNDTLPLSQSIIHLKDDTDIVVYADPSVSWTQDGFDYKISITTMRGNFFETIASPYNT
ncbi:MAG: hypothetical protein IH792_05780 [Thaumarchaeota archaeon]|nr:hypothetical protein [Nitrososphaerota archaeon]